uniref:Uncharacterized protein n=1 Tax=Arundo donax TaxID=35708 RepID=A0A0A8Y2F6_ARUDO
MLGLGPSEAVVPELHDAHPCSVLFEFDRRKLLTPSVSNYM